MYQSEMKEGFIKDYLRSRVVARTSLYSLFRKTAPFEEKANKDCSQFTEDEVIAMYNEFNSKSMQTLFNYNVILKAYCAWRRHYHKDQTTEAYEYITTKTLKQRVSIKANKFLSREDITEIEDQLLNYTDKAILEALWEGISGPNMRDLVSIQDYMVHHDEKMLQYPDGREVQLTTRLCAFLKKAFEETQYLCYGDFLKVTTITRAGKLYKERDNVRGKISDDKAFRWVYRKIQRFRKYVGIPGLTMKNIHISGFYHYLRQGVQESGLDLKEFLRSADGKKLAEKYGFHSDAYVDNLYYRFKDIIEGDASC